MELFFLFTIPFLVLLVTIAGVFQLVRSKVTGKKMPGSSTTGLDVLETTFRPTAHYRIQEEERKRLEAEQSGNEAPPKN